MAVFKFVVSNPKTRKSYSLELEQDKGAGLLGKRIGEKFNGDLMGLSGFELQITGGTDKDGFPMHPSVHGQVRKKIVIANPPAFHPKLKGQRRRKTVRGNTISKEITQINCKILKEGKKPIENILGKKPEEKPEEAPKEEVKPEKKEEKPKEEKKPEKEEKKEKPEKDVKKEEPEKEDKSAKESEPEKKKEKPKEEKPKESEKEDKK